MGQKVNPTGFRTGISKTWLATWFAEGEEYRRCLHEDLLLRREIVKEYKHAGIDRILTDVWRAYVVIVDSMSRRHNTYERCIKTCTITNIPKDAVGPQSVE